MSASRFYRDEDGVALIMALLGIVILSGLAIVFVSRSVNETRFSVVSRDFESAIHIAEAAADDQVRRLNADDLYVTRDKDSVEIVMDPLLVSDEEAWALDLLERMREADGAWATTSGGEAYAVRPRDSETGDPINMILAVGAVPSFDAANARVRVLKLQIDQDRFVPEHALLTDGELHFGGNAAIIVPGCETGTVEDRERTCVADVHTNQTFTSSGTASLIEGRVSQVEGQCPSPVTAVNGCVDGDDGVEAKPIPAFSARDFYNRTDVFNADPGEPSEAAQSVEWFDLCPDQTVRRPVGTTPCTGDPIWPDGVSSTFRGWKWQANKWQGSSIGAGVFYVYHADAKVTGSYGTAQRAVSILVEQNPAAPATSGSLDLSGNPKLQSAMQDVLFIVDADLDMQGTATAGSCGENPAAMSGFIGVGEQLKTQGTVELRGAIIVQDRAEQHNLVQRTNDGVGGTMCLEFDKTLAMDFTGIWVITFWNEL
jgi:hypothetical protein